VTDITCPVCPDDLTTLVRKGPSTRCPECGRHFTSDNGVLELLPRESSQGASAENNLIDLYQDTFSKTPDSTVRIILGEAIKILGNGYLYSWLAKKIEEVAMTRDLTLLDAACGDGILRRYIAKRHDYTGIDFCQRPLARALHRNPGRYFRADLTHLPFESATFDLVVSCQALQYLSRADLAVLQIARVLKPGGKFLLTVPNPKCLKYRLQGIAPIQLQRFHRNNIRSLLNAHFDIEHAETRGFWVPLPKISLHLPGAYPIGLGLSWTVLATMKS
jgi:SAM-dependent methyltransferase